MPIAKLKINDVCNVYDGPHATPSPCEDGPVYLGIPSIRSDGTIDIEGSKKISWEEYPRWTKRVTPQENDVVFSYEANLDTYAIIPPGFVGCLGRRMAIMRPNTEVVNPRFLYYYMLSPKWKETIAKKTVTGATVNRIPIAKYPDFPIEIPTLKEQDRIADILSAYDKLIENNRRQIALLEEAAQRLYKKWFIDLKFPGHESVAIVDGIPDGWAKGSLSELVEFKRGKTITSAQTEAGSVPVVAGGLTPAYYHSRSNTSSPVITVSGSGANAGYTHLYTEKIWASDCSFADASMTDVLPFVFESIINLGNGFKHLQRGSAQPHVYPKHINAMPLLIPTSELQTAFCDAATPAFSQIDVLRKEISKAMEVRIRLLPKLMSGEVEVM